MEKHMKMRNILITAALLFISSAVALAQEKINDDLQIDKFVHNFGDIMLSDGPVSCELTITNTGVCTSTRFSLYAMMASSGP